MCFSCKEVCSFPPGHTRTRLQNGLRPSTSSLRPRKQSGPLAQMPGYFLTTSNISDQMSHFTQTPSHTVTWNSYSVFLPSSCVTIVDPGFFRLLIYHQFRLPGLPGKSRMRRSDPVTRGLEKQDLSVSAALACHSLFGKWFD